jgi:hypothetical protein
MADHPPDWNQVLELTRRRPAASSQETGSALETVLRLASSTVPATLGCSLTQLGASGGAFTRASSNELALTLDKAQYEAGHGPCVLAARTGRFELVPSFEDDARYPELGRAAAPLGVQCSASWPLQTLEGGAALNFYGAGDASFASGDAARRAMFVTRIVAALLGSEPGEYTLSAAESREVDHSRRLIQQAEDIVIARSGVGRDRAFHQMALQSGRHDDSLIEIARKIVSGKE